MALGQPSPIRDLGPGVVELGGVEIGPTYGGIKWMDTLEKVLIHEDGHGMAPVDMVDTGHVVTGEAIFTRLALTAIEDIVPGSTAGVNNLTVDNRVGNQYYAAAQELIFKPVVNDVTSVTTTEWVHFHKAVIIPKFEVGYDNEGQRVMAADIIAFPDDTSGRVGEIYRIGPA